MIFFSKTGSGKTKGSKKKRETVFLQDTALPGISAGVRDLVGVLLDGKKQHGLLLFSTIYHR
jgi:hypothetical protein